MTRLKGLGRTGPATATAPGKRPPARQTPTSPIDWPEWLGASDAEARFLQARPSEQERLRAHWAYRAHDAQLPPRGAWTTWLFLGGRGAGKTRAGAEWLRAEALVGGRFALVGPTLHDVREVMIEGPSGLRAAAGPAERPTYGPARRRLVWPNGAEAHAFSAEDADSLRGPQFHAAWADELCAWRRPEAVLANLRLGLRLGARPRLVLTTTPRPTAALRRLLAEPGLAVTRAATAENAHNLAPGFLRELHALYAGTRLAAQELEGMVVEDAGAALWRAEDLARSRGPAPSRLERVVLAVDPPATATGDACGLVVAGRAEGRGYVLADRSRGGLSPMGWGRRAAELAQEFGCSLIVAEANQGGEMVRTVLAMADAPAPVKLVHARLGKRARAEPVAALYEQGRVTHCGAFPQLEEELMALGGGELTHSPDRADALVWALSELMLGEGGAPRARVL